MLLQNIHTSPFLQRTHVDVFAASKHEDFIKTPNWKQWFVALTVENLLQFVLALLGYIQNVRDKENRIS
jgi:hypothetical protein